MARIAAALYPTTGPVARAASSGILLPSTFFDSPPPLPSLPLSQELTTTCTSLIEAPLLSAVSTPSNRLLASSRQSHTAKQILTPLPPPTKGWPISHYQNSAAEQVGKKTDETVWVSKSGQRRSEVEEESTRTNGQSYAAKTLRREDWLPEPHFGLAKFLLY